MIELVATVISDRIAEQAGTDADADFMRIRGYHD
jgi:hypothetical protein